MAARTEQEVRKVATTWLAGMDLLLPAAARSEARPEPTDPRWGRRHIAHVMVWLTDTLQTLEVPTTLRPMALWELLRERAAATPMLARIGTQVSADDTPQDLLPQARSLVLTARNALGAGRSLPVTVETLVGPARFVDHLRVGLVEAATLGMRDGLTLPRPVLMEVSRTLATALGQVHGGRTIEMRVPPATAIQLSARDTGPDHHRGTPPNVAETDMTTFIALATGLTTWDDARSAGRIQASGSHVEDVADMLPVIPLASSFTALLD